MNFMTFETQLGHCALAWTPAGIRVFRLPHPTAQGAANALLAEFPELTPGTPPSAVRALCLRIARHFTGKAEDFSDVALDLDHCPPFHRKVYAAARQVKSGTTATYGDLALAAGSPRAARAVGQAMAKNPVSVIIPCHRVLGGSGIGGFSAPGGLSTKEKLLAAEGVQLPAKWDPREAETFLRGADPVLGTLMDRVGPYTLKRALRQSPFEALVRAIVFQQLHGKAASTIHGRVAALFPREKIVSDLLLKLPKDKLRGAGLSENKFLALKDLAQKTEDGLIPGWRELNRLTDDAIVERLTQVRGIGRWTVEMMLIFRMGRSDVMPVDDFAIRKGFELLYKTRSEVKPAKVLAYSERWRPYRSVASWYLWRSLDTATP